MLFEMHQYDIKILHGSFCCKTMVSSDQVAILVRLILLICKEESSHTFLLLVLEKVEHMQLTNLYRWTLILSETMTRKLNTLISITSKGCVGTLSK